MMDAFVQFMGMIFEFMKTPMNIFGFVFSYYDVMVTVIVASILGLLIREVFD